MPRILAAALVIACALATTAQSATMWTFDRISDKVAILTGTGTLDIDFDESSFIASTRFIDASATIGDPDLDLVAGDLTFGTEPLFNAFILNGSRTLRIGFGEGVPVQTDIMQGAGIAGSATITLDVEVWAAAGTTGLVEDGGGNQIGTYTIVSRVPLPAPALMLLGALGLLGLARRRAA